MSVTYTLANKILDFNLGATAYSALSTLYLGLSTTTISIDGTGATEPSGGAYARVAIINNKTNFSTATLGVLSNATAIQFTESTASWGVITYVFLADALTSGNIYLYEALSTPKTVQSATTVLFSVGALSFSMINS
jgi:hypothetical protein